MIIALSNSFQPYSQTIPLFLKMHSLKGALTGLTLTVILLASEALAHPTHGKALDLRTVGDAK